jgi:hypothetical protein
VHRANQRLGKTQNKLEDRNKKGNDKGQELQQEGKYRVKKLGYRVHRFIVAESTLGLDVGCLGFITSLDNNGALGHERRNRAHCG